MKNELLTAIIIITTLILVFRKNFSNLLKSKKLRDKFTVDNTRYLVLIVFLIFIILLVQPPWLFCPLIVTIYSLLGQQAIRRNFTLHLTAANILLVSGILLSLNIISIGYEKNEIFLLGHYLDITHEIGPILLLTSLPVVFSCVWKFFSNYLERKQSKNELV